MLIFFLFLFFALFYHPEKFFAKFWNDKAIIFRIKPYNPLTKQFYKQDSISHDAKKYHYQDMEPWN